MKTTLSSGHNERRYGQWLSGIIIPLFLTLICWPFRHLLNPSNILLLYLLGVFFVSIRLGFLPSILASLSSAAAFAFFFAPPIFSLAIVEPENLIGLAVMQIVAAFTSNLAANMRHQAHVAQQRERRVSALYQFSQALAETQSIPDIVRIAEQHLSAEFGGCNVLLLPDNKNLLQGTNAVLLPMINWVLAQEALSEGQIKNDTQSLPNGRLTYLPLKGTAGTLAVLVMESTQLSKNRTVEQQQLFETFVNQIGHSLEKAQLAEQAKEANLKIQTESLRNSLLSSISHDLRTPLASIVCAATSLEADLGRLPVEHNQQLAHAISEEALRMSELTSKILEMARLEAGEVVLNRQWYAIEETIGCALARLDKKLKHRAIHVQIAEHPGLVYVDEVLLQQVLVNLLENADKYSPPHLAIEITVQTQSSELVIAVADDGLGIPEELQEKIFAKFFRIHNEQAQSGVGLGLSVCKAIVEAHQGCIQVKSRPNGGNVFEVRLPLLESPPLIEVENEVRR